MTILEQTSEHIVIIFSIPRNSYVLNFHLPRLLWFILLRTQSISQGGEDEIASLFGKLGHHYAAIQEAKGKRGFLLKILTEAESLAEAVRGLCYDRKLSVFGSRNHQEINTAKASLRSYILKLHLHQESKVFHFSAPVFRCALSDCIVDM
jgi:hypothetical protein